jgi:hypothetical protein
MSETPEKKLENDERWNDADGYCKFCEHSVGGAREHAWNCPTRDDMQIDVIGSPRRKKP